MAVLKSDPTETTADLLPLLKVKLLLTSEKETVRMFETPSKLREKLPLDGVSVLLITELR